MSTSLPVILHLSYVLNSKPHTNKKMQDLPASSSPFVFTAADQTVCCMYQYICRFLTVHTADPSYPLSTQILYTTNWPPTIEKSITGGRSCDVYTTSLTLDNTVNSPPKTHENTLYKLSMQRFWGTNLFESCECWHLLTYQESSLNSESNIFSQYNWTSYNSTIQQSDDL